MTSARATSHALRAVAIAASEVVRASAPVRVAVLENPLTIDICADDFRIARVGASLAELAPTMPGPFVCAVDGEYIARAHWGYAPRPGSVVVFQAVPQGGGGSNPLRIILTIALIVASIYVPGLLGFTAGTPAFAAASAAISIAGSLIINALVPLPKPPGFGGGTTSSPTYNVALQANTARPEQPSPVGYGQLFTYPDFASQPYITYVNGEQFYHAIFCVGKGEYEILRTQIGDTDTRSFEDVQTAYVGPGQASTDVAGGGGLVDSSMATAIEVSGQELRDSTPVGPFAASKSGTQISTLHIDIACPSGLGAVEDDGSITESTISWEVRARLINNSDQHSGNWVTVASETLTRSTSTPVQVSYSYPITPGRYQVAVIRSSEFVDNTRNLNILSWTGLRATLTRPGIVDPTGTYVALRIRASKQLSGSSQRKVGVLWRRKLQVFNGATWSLQHTRNPAWALWDVWTNSEYGRGLPADRIDLASVYAMAQKWDLRQDRFDYMFDTRMTVYEAGGLIARAGRAVAPLRRGRYTLMRDEAQTLPVAMFHPRNMKKGSFSLDYTMPSEDAADAIRVQYHDGRFWDARFVIAQIQDGEVVVYAQESGRPAGVAAPTKILDVDLPGIIGAHQSWREAAYMCAVARFRRASVSWTADKEGLLPAYGSLLAVAHDVPSWGQHAEVLAYDAVSKTITASQPMQWVDGVPHFVRMQSRTGDVSPPLAVSRGATDSEVIFDDVPPFTPVFDDAEREPTKLLFGGAESVCEMVRLKSMRPASDDSIAMVGVVEDARVHAADVQWLPVGGEVQDPLSDGSLPSGGTSLENTDISGYTVNLPENAGGQWFMQSGPYAPGNAQTIEAAYEIRADGSLHALHRVEGALISATDAGNVYGPESLVDTVINGWISPRPASATVTGLYQVRVTSQSGVSGPALGVWHAITGPLRWGVSAVATAVSTTAEMTVEIRRTDTFLVVATRTVALALVGTGSTDNGG